MNMKNISHLQKNKDMLLTIPPQASSSIEIRVSFIDFFESIIKTRSDLSDIHESVSDDGLNLLCLSYSENSLKEEWDNENDSYWESYL